MRRFSARFLVVLTLLTVWTACGAPGPADAAEHFFRLVEQGELDQAVDMISGELLSMGRDKVKAALAEQTRQISEMGGIRSIETLEEEIQGQVAKVQLKVTFGDETSSLESMDLTKIDGAWKLTPSMEK